LVADMKTLEAFHMRCQRRQILDLRWWAHVSNTEVLQRSDLSTIGDIIRHRRLSLFGRVARLDHRVPAHDALRLIVDTYEGNVWLNKVQEDANAAIYAVEIWDCQGSRSGATVHSDYATTMTMMMMV